MPDAPSPPRICQFCSADLSVTFHKMTCRIVTDVEGIAGRLDLPPKLDRRKPKPL